MLYCFSSVPIAPPASWDRFPNKLTRESLQQGVTVPCTSGRTQTKALSRSTGSLRVARSCPTLCNLTDCSPPGSSVHGFSSQEYWSGLPSPSPGDLPDPGRHSKNFSASLSPVVGPPKGQGPSGSQRGQHLPLDRQVLHLPVLVLQEPEQHLHHLAFTVLIQLDGVLLKLRHQVTGGHEPGQGERRGIAEQAPGPSDLGSTLTVPPGAHVDTKENSRAGGLSGLWARLGHHKESCV